VSDAALKALTKETKALILVSEYEARRMPMFQMRAVLNAIVSDDEERKLVIDLIDRDLRATGYPPEQIGAFLSDLLAAGSMKTTPDIGQSVQSTRRLRSPFAMGFEAAMPPVAPPAGPTVSPALSAPEGDVGGTKILSPRPGFIKTSPSSGDIPASITPSSLTVTPAAGTPARRNTFIFDAPPAAGAPAAAPGGDNPPVGTIAWRQQQAFAKAAGGSAGATRPLILLADDDKRIRMVFRLRIEEAGLAVVEAGTGDEAWARIQQGGIALAVLDMKMPGLHGLEVLSQMSNKQITIPVVICSAYDQLQDEFVVRTYPHLRYLVKPVAPESLVNAIRELLAPKPQS
jgi:CheY-like chemotaxis protein